MPAIELGPLKIDLVSQRVFRGEEEIELTTYEYKVFEYLLMHPDEVVTRTILLEQVWGYRFDPKTSLVQTHMSRLRAKVDKPFDVALIRTVRGSGYVLGTS